MTNPNDIIRTRARTGGRASVYEANAWAQMLSTGLLDGNGVTQNTSADMNVLVGGSSTNPDVLIAKNPSGYKIALDVVGQQAVVITAPTSNSRISSIVAYTDDLALSTTQDDITGSPASCGLIVVNGAASSSPVAPDDDTIRAAITADGATGSQASYVVIADVTVSSATTAITNSLISINKAGVTSQNVDFKSLGGSAVALGRYNHSSGNNDIWLDTPLSKSELIVLVVGHSQRRLAITTFPVMFLESFANVELGAPAICYQGSGFVGLKYVTRTHFVINADVQNLTYGGNATDCVTHVYRVTPQ